LLLCHLAQLSLVFGVTVAVQKRDGDGAISFAIRAAQGLAGLHAIKRGDDTTLGIASLVDFGHVTVEQIGQPDIEGKKVRPVLVADS